jgi:hypothetical protein
VNTATKIYAHPFFCMEDKGLPRTGPCRHKPRLGQALSASPKLGGMEVVWYVWYVCGTCAVRVVRVWYVCGTCGTCVVREHAGKR